MFRVLSETEIGAPFISHFWARLTTIRILPVKTTKKK